ncbi:MAG: AAA family ATPase [bacterium]|nr:AAA family ATPase [bacterium]
MPAKLDTISRFSPGNCSPELLESILVGRHDLVDRMEKSVLDSAQTGAGHHWLLIGPRGTGKTHLLAILHNRIDANEAVRSRFAIAYMKEEERGVASFLDLLVRILRAFCRRGERPPSDDNGFDLSEKLAALKRMPLTQAQAEAEKVLIHFVGARRLLLIAENLGAMFSETKGMGREGQQRLRDLVQQHPFWNIVASSQALFEDVQAHKAPFYGFFKVHHLPMLTLEEANKLLRSLARLDSRQRLEEFFATEAGRGRVRAIHELTGGNPRLLVIFFQFVDRDSIEDLSPPFLEMVDNLTSYYQEQMHPLPALQQKIVEFLCEHRSPATVKEVAQSCFITHQTASAQLKRLAKRRYVQSTSVGREAFYELREPLFRICFEVKENMGYPIRLFVDFLGNFYPIEYHRALELDPRHCYAQFNISLSLFQSGDQEAGLRQMEIAAETEAAEDWETRMPECIKDINEYLLRNTDVDHLTEVIRRQRTIFDGNSLRDPFIQGLTASLMELLRQHDEVPLERLIEVRDRVIPDLAEAEDLSVACRLFEIGVTSLEPGNPRALLQLPLEERRSLEEILGKTQ